MGLFEHLARLSFFGFLIHFGYMTTTPPAAGLLASSMFVIENYRKLLVGVEVWRRREVILLAEYAKELYLQIVRIIRSKEMELGENQDTKVTLVHYPDLEVKQIGRLGSEFLFFSGRTRESSDTTLLLPAEPIPIRIDVVDRPKGSPARARPSIGFRGDVSED